MPPAELILFDLEGTLLKYTVTWGFRLRSELEASGAVYIADAVTDIIDLTGK